MNETLPRVLYLGLVILSVVVVIKLLLWLL